MPNIKSAEKRVKVAAVNRQANMAKRSKLKTYLKKAVSSITAGEKETAKADILQAIKGLDQSATQGIIHKNQAARRKSRMMKKLNAM